ncbi:hypothetical protein BS17DRAFT_795522 [Gyrodon lividus]|nr:hypothetical protein BS17DRAFT_795522 [Gyrodon lividus]
MELQVASCQKAHNPKSGWDKWVELDATNMPLAFPQWVAAFKCVDKNSGRNQYCQWSQDVIPALLNPHMCYLRLTWSLPTSVDMNAPLCCGGSCAPRQLTVICLYFDSPLQLMALGLFGCAPVSPSLAVDLHVLELVKALFVRMTPNMSGWSEALEVQRFSTAYHWYLILTIMVAEHVHMPTLNSEDVDVSDSKHTQSSQYLRSWGPLCFRGKDWECNGDGTDDIDVIVCINACFTQKRSCNAHNNVTHDLPNPTQTIFISESNIKAMEAHVEEHCDVNRSRKRPWVLTTAGDGFENGMKILMSVLDACGNSFIAADEKCEKASTCYFVDTGLMVMLCCHDRVLWLRLFDHLSLDTLVGLLYNISCQLEHSCRKWGFLLEAILSWLTFTIAVFHTYGHQWACQVVYHPQKCVGFGLFLTPLISLFVLDHWVCHLCAKSLEGFGDWLHWWWMHYQWADQIAHQTVPLARQAKNKGKEETARVLGLDKVLEHQWIVIDDLEHQLAMDSICDVVDLDICLIEARHKLMMTTMLVEKCRAALGVYDQVNLAVLKCNVYLQCAYCMTINENRLHDHVQAAINNYNTLCNQLQRLINSHPPCISHQDIFQLDVNNDLWQEIGLDDTTTDPPLWLVDENVHMGICHLLEYDQCVEEEARLNHEQCVLQEWTISQWKNLQQAREKAARFVWD